MDRAITEIADFFIEESTAGATEAPMRELNELQLALVGGGYGDTVI